jgi:hypothetical protein
MLLGGPKEVLCGWCVVEWYGVCVCVCNSLWLVGFNDFGELRSVALRRLARLSWW